MYGSLLIFLITSLLWIFFHKPLQYLHYASLITVAFTMYTWLSVSLSAQGFDGDPDFIFRTQLPVSRMAAEFIYYTALFLIGYSVIALLVAGVRSLLALKYIKLVKYALIGITVGGIISLSTHILPCEYALIGCWEFVGMERPQTPQI